ncbi:M61 family metallopeptidase [Anthocerotibacter panamensis]|uniref:M61 family metallopeptidase n=1 Tax=Anthocerotibacter panamensis TaxID=2857077 RepID=UPI001C402FC5|nr:PDZ domain-containing protein [Anthocerotibacter panamensis]
MGFWRWAGSSVVGLAVLPPAVSAVGITYTVAMPDPTNHYYQVQMQVSEVPAEPQHLVMPVWTPGSYLVREFARNVQGVQAVDSQGQPLTVTKTDKHTWKIAGTSTGGFTVNYQVYANELTVRSSHLTSDHGYFNGASIFPYLDGYKETPITLVIQPAATFKKIATGLPLVSEKNNTFQAQNYDILVDSPVLVGNFKEYSFTVRNVPHRLILDGQGNYDAPQLTNDVKKIVEEQSRTMGTIPYPDYTFLMLLSATGSGGLEHLNSTSLQVGFDRFKPAINYRRVLGLVSHEFFHLWNVKRIRPLGLGPFDYTREVYTNNLWIAEGTTSYYDDLFVRRAGLMETDIYLQNLADAIKDYQQTPGRLVQSLAQASFDTWIKYYRPDENSVNSSISYYDKGALVSFLLDMELRRLTDNRQSLDDVLRLMNQNFGQPGQPGYTDRDFQQTCEKVAGTGLADFFQKSVYTTAELDFKPALALAGLALKTESSKGEDDPKKRAYFGADIRNETGPALITNVRSATPAALAGLNAGDDLIAIDGIRVDASSYKQRLADYLPPATVQFTVVRDRKLLVLPVTLQPQPDDIYKIARLPKPTAQQRAIYESWLKDTWKK